MKSLAYRSRMASMVYPVKYQIKCSKCGLMFSMDSENEFEVVDFIIAIGWHVTKSSVVYCRTCKKSLAKYGTR